MRRVLTIAFLVLLGMAAAAQIKGTPASVTSAGAHSGHGIPASVTSLGPHGFGPAGSFGGSATFAHGKSTIAGPWPRPRPGYGSTCYNCRRYPVAYPAYIPYVPTYLQYGMEEPLVQPGVEYQTGQVGTPANVYEPPPADVTEGSNRYGNHYLDDREARRREEPAVSVTTGSARPPQPEREDTAAAPEEPPTVLVFKDGHQREVHNYAIIGTTLWDLSDHLTRKIPLAEIDLDATTKLNDERGTPFRYPRHS